MPERQQWIAHPITTSTASGKLAQAEGYGKYVQSLIRQVLLTNPGERVNRPTFGAGLSRLVFAPTHGDTATLAKTIVYEALVTWLGELIQVEEVETRPIEAGIEVQVVYMLLARGERQFLNVEVTL